MSVPCLLTSHQEEWIEVEAHCWFTYLFSDLDREYQKSHVIPVTQQGAASRRQVGLR